MIFINPKTKASISRNDSNWLCIQFSTFSYSYVNLDQKKAYAAIFQWHNSNQNCQISNPSKYFLWIEYLENVWWIVNACHNYIWLYFLCRKIDPDETWLYIQAQTFLNVQLIFHNIKVSFYLSQIMNLICGKESWWIFLSSRNAHIIFRRDFHRLIIILILVPWSFFFCIGPIFLMNGLDVVRVLQAYDTPIIDLVYRRTFFVATGFLPPPLCSRREPTSFWWGASCLPRVVKDHFIW